jgi:hypothetical protein
MTPYKYLALDSYPLSNAAITPAQPGATPTESERCHQWMQDCEAAGIILLAPAISYYEAVRDLYLRGATAKITRFQKFCFDPLRFVALTEDHLTEAAKLWATLRNQGLATADKQALDGDAIFAAQVLDLQLPTGQFTVVTRNLRHITRFGLPAEQWENIAP